MKLIETIENRINNSKIAELLLKKIVGEKPGPKKRKLNTENRSWRRPNPNIPNGTHSKG